MHRLLATAALGLLPWVVVSFSASAETGIPCYEREAFLAWLLSEYAERPVAAGVRDDKLIQLLVRPDGRSWTIVVLRPVGPACPLAAGTDWVDLMNPRADPDAQQGTPPGPRT
jgi:hypothetical protein